MILLITTVLLIGAACILAVQWRWVTRTIPLLVARRMSITSPMIARFGRLLSTRLARWGILAAVVVLIFVATLIPPSPQPVEEEPAITTTAVPPPSCTVLDELQEYHTFFSHMLNSSKPAEQAVQATLKEKLELWINSTAPLLTLNSTQCTEELERTILPTQRHGAQELFNIISRDRYDKFQQPRLPVVSYVMKRPDLFSQVIDSIKAQQGSDNIHMIVSMDRFNLSYLAMLEQRLTFCTYQIIVHTFDFEAFQYLDDTGQAIPATKLAFHWWWLQSTLWSDLLHGYDGDAFFIEEDQALLSRHALQLARDLFRLKSQGVAQVETISMNSVTPTLFGGVQPFLQDFGDAAGAMLLQPVFSNMGYGFNRSLYERILPFRKPVVDWDWNLMVAFHRGDGQVLTNWHLQAAHKRVVNLGMCNPVGGLHAHDVPRPFRKEYCGSAMTNITDLDSVPESSLGRPNQLNVYRFNGYYKVDEWVKTIVPERFTERDCRVTNSTWLPRAEVCVLKGPNDAFPSVLEQCPSRYELLRFTLSGAENIGPEGFMCVPDHQRWYLHEASAGLQ